MTVDAITRARNKDGSFITEHGGTGSREFAIWKDMRRRCRSHPRYAGRSIAVCERWQSFEDFLTDMGKCPPGLSLDRIDNGGDYEPGNCRWADAKTQARNTRRCRYLTVDGVSKSLSEWAEIRGIAVGTLWIRIKSGWPIEKALTPGDARKARGVVE